MKCSHVSCAMRGMNMPRESNVLLARNRYVMIAPYNVINVKKKKIVKQQQQEEEATTRGLTIRNLKARAYFVRYVRENAKPARKFCFVRVTRIATR